MHNPLGPISTAACLQLNLVISNFGVQEQPRRPDETLGDAVPAQPTWRDRYLLPPTAPALGIEFDREAARRYPRPVSAMPTRRPPSARAGSASATRRRSG